MMCLKRRAEIGKKMIDGRITLRTNNGYKNNKLKRTKEGATHIRTDTMRLGRSHRGRGEVILTTASPRRLFICNL
jgi:hypothetical protein